MKLTKTCAKFLRKHGGTILAIGASIGVGLTMWETGKATVKATTLVTMNKDEPMTKKKSSKTAGSFMFRLLWPVLELWRAFWGPMR